MKNVFIIMFVYMIMSSGNSIYISNDVTFSPTNGNIYKFEMSPASEILIGEDYLKIDDSVLKVTQITGEVNISVYDYGVVYPYYYKSFTVKNSSSLDSIDVSLSGYPNNNKVMLFKNTVLNETLVTNTSGYAKFTHYGFSTVNFTLISMPVVSCDSYNLTQGSKANGWYTNGTICFANMPIEITSNNKKEVVLESLINNTIDMDITFNVSKCTIDRVYIDGGTGYWYKLWQDGLNCSGPAEYSQATVLFKSLSPWESIIKTIYDRITRR